MTDLAGLRAEFAAALRQAAEATGDGRFAVAAGILAGQRPGRRRIDDAAAVAQTRALLEAGVATSVTAAARLVAKTGRECATLDAVTRRIAAAYRKAHVEN